jgi:putative membrane protein
MRMTIHGWRGAVFAAAIALGGTASAQTSGSSSSGTTGSSGSSGSSSSEMSGSSSRSGGKLDKSLDEAVQKLHAANQGEIQSAQLATQTAQSQEVKSFAQHMMTDHQQNDQRLQQLAQTMGASLQGQAFDKMQKKSQDEMQKVQAKTGAEFDKAYMKMMIDDHKKDVKEVESAAKDAKKQKQTELASFLDQTHSKMQMHLQEAQRIEKSLGKGGASAQSGSSDSATQGTGSSSSRSSSGMSGSSSTGADTSGTGSSSGSATGVSGASGSPGSQGGSAGGSNTGHGGTVGGTVAPGTAPSGGSPGPAGSSSDSSSGGTRTP